MVIAGLASSGFAGRGRFLLGAIAGAGIEVDCWGNERAGDEEGGEMGLEIGGEEELGAGIIGDKTLEISGGAAAAAAASFEVSFTSDLDAFA